MESIKDKYTKEHSVVFQSKEMERIIKLASRAAMVESPVLIQGDSGVGKETITNLLHRLNPIRGKYPIIKVNCSAIPHNLMESEFFGYEPNIFIGGGKCGKLDYFEMADKGTIFLDEIDELTPGLQVGLLRILQGQEIIRNGGIKTKKVDVRVVAATKRDLELMIKEKSFREDLYYHINVIPIRIPPLRERKSDIVPLLFHFLNIYNKKYNLEKCLSDEVVDCLTRYDWPGNVRELINLVERLVVTTESQQITLGNLSPKYCIEKNSNLYRLDQMNLTIAKEELEKCLVTKALRLHKSTYKAAKVLGVSQSTVIRMAKKYQLSKSIENTNYHRLGG